MLRVTKTENGLVRGITGTDARITVFKGIPFADDTSGANRWRPPQPAKDWDGIRECYEFGPISMQRTPGKDPTAFYAKEWHVDPEVPMGEDCLRANIWTPAHTADEKLPVMVWIFGGGLQEGYPYEMEFDGYFNSLYAEEHEFTIIEERHFDYEIYFVTMCVFGNCRSDDPENPGVWGPFNFDRLSENDFQAHVAIPVEKLDEEITLETDYTFTDGVTSKTIRVRFHYVPEETTE